MNRNSKRARSNASRFSRVKRLVRSRFGDATRESLSSLVATLRLSEYTGATASTYLAPELRKVVAELVADISGRIQRAQNEFDFLVLERIQFADKPDTGFVARLHPSLSVVADRLSHAIQLSGRQAYQAYAHRVHVVSKVGWIHDRLNPLGADVLARAYLACLTDCLDTAEKRSVIEPLLLSNNAQSLFGVIAHANDFMDALQIDPAPAERVLQFGRHHQQRARPVREQASIEQAVASDTALPAQGSAPVNAIKQQVVPAPSMTRPHPYPPNHSPHTAADSSVQLASQRKLSQGLQVSDSALDEVAAIAGKIRPEVAARADTGARLGGYTALQTIARIEDNALRFAHQVGEQAHTKRTRRIYFETVREQLRLEQCPASQLSVVDLVAAMFDLVIDDRRLPDIVRPLVWRLQQPALVLSLLDPGYLGDHRRSLRTLLENLGELVAQFEPDLSRDCEAFRRLETLVRAVEIVSARLADRSRELAFEVDKAFDHCANSIMQLVDRLERDRRAFDQAPGQINRRDFSRRPARDEERRVSDHIKARIAEKTKGFVLPASVRAFLDSVWMRYMRTALLREGASSEIFKNAELLIDDLLWTIDEHSGAGNRRQLAQRIPILIGQVNTGMREVNAKEHDHQAFFDELFLIHLRKLRRLPDSATTTVGPDRTAQVTRSRHGTDAAASSKALSSDAPDPALGGMAAPTIPVLQSTVALGPHDSGSFPATTPATVSIVGPLSEAASRKASNDDDVTVVTVPLGGNRLLSVLQDIDLEDLPAKPATQRDADNVGSIEMLAYGDWLEYRQANGQCVNLKVAWISDRRSVVLLVRHPDRRAISKPMRQLKKLFATGRLRLIRVERAA